MGKTDMSNNDLSFEREFTVEVAEMSETGAQAGFAVCIHSDDEKLLIPMKIYQVQARGKDVRVIDEEGEAAIYPGSFFMPLKLAPALEEALSQAAM